MTAIHSLCLPRNGRLLAQGLSLLIAGCLGTNALCQEAKPSGKPIPPTGVLLNAPPDFSQWVVTFSYPQDQPVAVGSKRPPINGDLPRKVTVTKTRNILHEETVSLSGAKFDKWQNNGTFYIKPPGQSYWGVCDEAFMRGNPSSDIRRLPILTNKFRDLEWVDGKTYVGTLRDQSKEYLLFVPSSSTSIDVSNPAELKAQPIIAYIDAATRLPVVLRSGGLIQQYTFGNAPTEMQSFPPDLIAEIKDGEERQAKVFVAPHKEY